MDTRPLKPYKILLVGDFCYDEYHYGFVDRISPEAPIPVFTFLSKETKNGMAGNVEKNLLNLGCHVESFFGIPSKKIRLIDSRSKQHIVRIDEDSVSSGFSYENIASLINYYDAVVISDYNKGFVRDEFILDVRKNFSGPIFIDTKKKDLKMFEGCIVKINAYEHRQLTSECSDLVVTMGSKGVVYKDKFYNSKPVSVVDVCGAGDTFLASLAYKYIETGNMDSSIQFAINASSITVQHMGVYAPKLEEICD